MQVLWVSEDMRGDVSALLDYETFASSSASGDPRPMRVSSSHYPARGIVELDPLSSSGPLLTRAHSENRRQREELQDVSRSPATGAVKFS